MTLLVLLAIAGVGGLAWRKRASQDDPPSRPSGGAIVGGLKVPPGRPRISSLAETIAAAERERLANEQRLARNLSGAAAADRDRAAAEAEAQLLARARETTSSQTEYTVLTEQLGVAREKVARAKSVSAAARAEAERIRAEEKAKDDDIRARIMELAPQRERLATAIREQQALSADARNAYLLLRQQRAAAVVANPWYKDVLGYEVTGSESESERPFATSRELVDADSERGRFIQSSMGSRVIVRNSYTGAVTEGNGAAVFANVLLVTSAMRGTADSIDDTTRRMADALRIEAESNAKTADMQAELDAINAAMTGRANGAKTLGAPPRASGRLVPIVLFGIGANSANGGGK